MKEIIKNYVGIVLEACFVIFCIAYILMGTVGEKKGLADKIGTIFEDVEIQNVKSEAHLVLKDKIESERPTVRYVGGTKRVGEFVKFKELVEVCLPQKSFESGIEEKGFYIYLEDIQDKNGNSVVISLKAEEIEALEEIPAGFILDEENGILYFHKSGVFVMYLMIYTEDEIGTAYECMLPIETS